MRDPWPRGPPSRAWTGITSSVPRSRYRRPGSPEFLPLSRDRGQKDFGEVVTAPERSDEERRLRIPRLPYRAPTEPRVVSLPVQNHLAVNDGVHAALAHGDE